ncbi:TetR/AcrR family transcriptional regulator [Sphingobium sp. HBC34]|uniref:TetR/AcrR family transcriptional regulator n=1 Tax=Sphingobium cyanobacteriorum TaxID=3063954 RepID=A0ABT8ZR76_9SPHN|nr:TetR/AcrR family transcriptional regulator [Sphingobium sp. HBC34]MDO7836588.1 TetR/AcrR family transcriptional regulator [Sphingobium sp. HBC34]
MIMSKLPKQDRGHERRNDILDAAGRILIELGEQGVSMHAVAASAGASTGSMYHFFRNRGQLLDALFERHLERMKAFLPPHSLDAPEPWRAMSVDQLIDGLFGQALAYFARHPDAIILVATRDLSFPAFKEVVATVLKHRMDARKAEEVAKMLVAVSTGTLQYLQKQPTLSPDILINHIPRVLASYLSSCEAQHCLPDQQER